MKTILSILCLLVGSCSSFALTERIETPEPGEWSTEMERTFQERSVTLLKAVGSESVIKVLENKSIPDPHKYAYPILLAQLSQFIELEGVTNIVENIEATYQKGTSYYHFAAIGLVRIYHQFGSLLPEEFKKRIETEWRSYDQLNEGQSRQLGVKEHSYLHDVEPELQKKFLEKYPDGFNPLFVGSGTENHKVMWRTSGYLLAQAGGDEKRMAQMKEWMQQYIRKLYTVGQGEWDSSTYLAFDITGFLNVYDFARDPEVKTLARAALDWYAATYALKYFQGVYSGAERRGFARSAVSTYTDFVGWIWFNDNPSIVPQRFNNSAKQGVHVALSSYRPHSAIVSLARKSVPLPFTAYASKPDYDMSRPNLVKEILYFTEEYALGSCNTSSGGWYPGENQQTMWKLVVKGTNGGYSISGGSPFHDKHTGRSPFDQFVQHQNVLIQMSVVPENAGELIRRVKEQAKAGAKSAESKVKNEVKQISYLAFPENVQLRQINDVYFAQLDQVLVAAIPLQKNSSGVEEKDSNTEKKKDTFTFLYNTGYPAGFVLEIGTLKQYSSLEIFQEALFAKSKLDLSSLTNYVVSYRSITGEEIQMTFSNPIQNTNPDLPSSVDGKFHFPGGGFPVASINGKILNYDREWPIYDCPYLEQPLMDGVFRVDLGLPDHDYLWNFKDRFIPELNTSNPEQGELIPEGWQWVNQDKTIAIK